MPPRFCPVGIRLPAPRLGPTAPQIHEHILIHGDIRKKTTMRIAGEDVEVEAYLDEDEADQEGAVKHSTTNLANRQSFVIMRDRMKARVRLVPGARFALCMAFVATRSLAWLRVVIAHGTDRMLDLRWVR